MYIDINVCIYIYMFSYLFKYLYKSCMKLSCNRLLRPQKTGRASHVVSQVPVRRLSSGRQRWRCFCWAQILVGPCSRTSSATGLDHGKHKHRFFLADSGQGGQEICCYRLTILKCFHVQPRPKSNLQQSNDPKISQVYIS